MKKIIIEYIVPFIISVIIVLGILCGLYFGSKYNPHPKKIWDQYVTIEERNDAGHKLFITYDKETKVMYTITGNRKSICPIYNSDGSVKIYDGDTK